LIQVWRGVTEFNIEKAVFSRTRDFSFRPKENGYNVNKQSQIEFPTNSTSGSPCPSVLALSSTELEISSGGQQLPEIEEFHQPLMNLAVLGILIWQRVGGILINLYQLGVLNSLGTLQWLDILDVIGREVDDSVWGLMMLRSLTNLSSVKNWSHLRSLKILRS
jgi:hypothetical protein